MVAGPSFRASRNTVQLGWGEDFDGCGWLEGGSGPVAVLGAFDAVVGHLAFDDACCAS